MTEGPAGDRRLFRLRVALWVLACLAYAAVALTSPGYDDEFYNMLVVGSGRALAVQIDFINHWDVHPPGQYLINAALFAMTGSWPVVRAIGALACALAVTRFAGLHRLTDARAMLLQFVLVVMHPALLMWCTGLRWTTYFVPLFLLALLWLRRDTSAPWRFWPVLALLCLGLFALNYLALLLVPLIVAFVAWRRFGQLRREWPAILVSAAVAAPFLLYQLQILVRFQLGVSGPQTSGPLAGLAGLAQGIAVHVGIFSLSVVGVVTLLAFAGLWLRLCLRQGRALVRDHETWLILGGLLLVLAAGLAGKWRNLVPLVPPIFARIVPLATRTPDRLSIALAWVLAASNLIGCVNVARHWDTNKGSWNMPVAATVEATRAAVAQRCGTATPVILTLDPVLAAHVAQRTPFAVIGPRPQGLPTPLTRDGDYCVLRLATYLGAVPDRVQAEMLRNLPPGEVVARIGRDPAAGIKRRLEPRIPDHYVEIHAHGRMRRVPDYLNLVARHARRAQAGVERPFD